MKRNNKSAEVVYLQTHVGQHSPLRGNGISIMARHVTCIYKLQVCDVKTERLTGPYKMT